MNPAEIMHLSHDQISTYVEKQVALGHVGKARRRHRASVIKEIAATRKDVILLSVRDDEQTFSRKVNQ